MKPIAVVLAVLLTTQPVVSQQRATFSTTTNVVVVNVTVTGRDGKSVENLTKDDFQVFEDGKLQKLQAVDFQQLSGGALPPLENVMPPNEHGTPKATPPPKAAAATNLMTKYQDRRLIVLLFDFSSMQPAEQIRAKKAAIKFLSNQMTASDTVSIMIFGTELNTLLDFTSNRDLLVNTINRFRIGESSENATFADEGADAQDQSGQFVADETEFNIFNSDLKLAALEDAVRQLGQYPEKKALIYISSGIQKNGVDNQSQLRATVNAAVRANVAFYPIDARGLSALVPGGDATQAGAVGNNLYSGAGQRSLKENFNNQQETLATLALDTGGKALLDSNDLTEGITQAQKDFSSYYILSYVSSNQAQDGRYRRIRVKLALRLEASLKPKLDYRQGYYAPTTFARMNEDDKEGQLSQAMLSENPVTDLPIAVEIDYFRLEKDKYFAPISVKIPGSALTFHAKGSKQATELDFEAEVRDPRGRPAATVRDTIPLKVTQDVAGQVVQKSLQYTTGVTLTPGPYKLRLVARENGEGKTGTFETSFTIPDLAAEKSLRVSSLILSNQRQPVAAQVGGVKNSKKLLAQDPLIQNGQQIVPNVTRVFQPGQNLFAYVEVYDPKVPDTLPENFRRPNVEASLAVYGSNNKVMETPSVRAARPDTQRQSALPVWFELPLNKMPPGEYECQVNLIDEFGRKFAFPRSSFAIVRSTYHPTFIP